MIFWSKILDMRLDMIGPYAVLADTPNVARADYWRIRETISVKYYIKIPNVMKHE